MCTIVYGQGKKLSTLMYHSLLSEMNIILSQVLNHISIIPEVGIDTGCQFVHSVFWSILEPDKQDKIFNALNL